MPDTADSSCGTCGGNERVACPGPATTNAERTGTMYLDWCYGMHMGHDCPDCTHTGN